jgi:hypothetical protein
MIEGLPTDQLEFLERELDRGERVDWLSQPILSWWDPGSLGTVLFAIPWTAFSIFWTVGAANMVWFDRGPNNGGPSMALVFPLFGLPFIAIGLGMLSTPWWVRRAKAKTVYALTDSRAIILQGGRAMTIRSLRPDEIGPLLRREKRDGSGDLILQQLGWRDAEGGTRNQEVGFLGVPEVREVERRVRALIERHTP